MTTRRAGCEILQSNKQQNAQQTQVLNFFKNNIFNMVLQRGLLQRALFGLVFRLLTVSVPGM